MDATRIEKDALGEVPVPAHRLWGAQTQRSIDNFPIGVARFAFGRPVVRAFGLVKQAAARANAELGTLPGGHGGPHRARRAGSDRRRVGRRIPARRVPDRVRHAVEHERQRGDRQPRDPAGRRHGRQQGARASERSREPQPVVQRRVSGRHAHRDRRGNRPRAAAGHRAAARDARREGAPLRGRRDARPHAPAGCDAGDAGPGDFRLGRAARRRAALRALRARRAVPAGAGRHGGGHRHQRAGALRRARRAPHREGDRQAVRVRRRTSSPRCRRTTRWSTRAPRCARSRASR